MPWTLVTLGRASNPNVSYAAPDSRLRRLPPAIRWTACDSLPNRYSLLRDQRLATRDDLFAARSGRTMRLLEGRVALFNSGRAPWAKCQRKTFFSLNRIRDSKKEF